MSATPEQNKDVVERLYREGINTGRFDTLRDLISGDFIGARGARDPAEFGQTISLPRRGFPDAHGTLEDLIAESDRVVARWEMAGTHLGPFAGFPASCNAVRPTAIVIYQLRNGKIVRVWRQPDSLGLMQQIGAIALSPWPRPERRRTSMNYLKQLEQEVTAWPGVSVGPHRFGGREFCYGNAEIGHIHPGGIVDIPMPLAIHDALLEERLAQQHRWVPDSGWITYQVTNAQGLAHGLWLLRLSYLRYALKQSEEPQSFFDREARALNLSPRFTALLAEFVPSREHARPR